MSGGFTPSVVDERAARRRALAWTALLIVLGLHVTNDVLGLIQGGGVFLVTRAIDAAAAGSRFIEVDGSGLRTLFVAGCALIATGVAAVLDVSPKNRVVSAVFVLSIIAGGFTLDTIYGEDLIGSWMADRGYHRCVARDRKAGSWKSRVWFDGFVRTMKDCPAAIRSIAADAPPIPADPRTALPRPAMPVEKPGDWFSTDDYPPEALRREAQGTVWFRFLVGADGRVSSCTIVRSSGSSVLDGTTCGVYMARARYWPARDRAGTPVAEPGTQHVTWQIPTH